MAVVLDVIRGLSKVLFRWALISCRLCEMILPKNGWESGTFCVREQMCVSGDAQADYLWAGREQVGVATCPSHIAPLTAWQFSWMGLVLFLFTEWTQTSISVQTIHIRFVREKLHVPGLVLRSTFIYVWGLQTAVQMFLCHVAIVKSVLGFKLSSFKSP